MDIIHGIESVRLKGVALTIGNFDGVHRGHQAIIAAARQHARRAEALTVVMTFEPHPASILTPDRVPPRLTPLEEKLACLERAGADVVVLVHSTKDFFSIPAERFLTNVILDRFHPVAVVEGPTFGFGRHRQGDIEMLRAAGSRHGFEVEIVEPVRGALGGHPDTVISSSIVRHLLSSGTVDGAAHCLGRPYALLGTVIRGAGRGRGLGFPTANLQVRDQLIPAEGVYAGRVRLGGSVAEMVRGHEPFVAAAVSIGRIPTFDETALVIEAFLLDFDDDLYGRHVRLELLDWLRRQEKYPSPGALVEQIERDVARTRELFNAHGRY